MEARAAQDGEFNVIGRLTPKCKRVADPRVRSIDNAAFIRELYYGCARIVRIAGARWSVRCQYAVHGLQAAPVVRRIPHGAHYVLNGCSDARPVARPRNEQIEMTTYGTRRDRAPGEPRTANPPAVTAESGAGESETKFAG